MPALGSQGVLLSPGIAGCAGGHQQKNGSSYQRYELERQKPPGRYELRSLGDLGSDGEQGHADHEPCDDSEYMSCPFADAAPDRGDLPAASGGHAERRPAVVIQGGQPQRSRSNRSALCRVVLDSREFGLLGLLRPVAFGERGYPAANDPDHDYPPDRHEQEKCVPAAI